MQCWSRYKELMDEMGMQRPEEYSVTTISSGDSENRV